MFSGDRPSIMLPHQRRSLHDKRIKKIITGEQTQQLIHNLLRSASGS